MALSSYQIAVSALTIGDNTIYDVKQEEGFTTFTVTDGDDPFPLQWGSISGADEVDARKIRLDIEMLNDPTTVQGFLNAFLPGSDVALRAMFPEFREEVTISVRVRKRGRVRTIQDVNGVVTATLELTAADPRLYGSTVNTMGVPVFSVGGDSLDLTAGAGADLGFDLTAGAAADLGFDFTGLTSTGLVICTNAGNVDTYPSFLFTPDSGGAMTAWTVTNQTTGEVASFATTLNPGSTMLVDFSMVATSKTGSPVTIAGSVVYSAWQQPRTPLRLIPGNNTLRFDVTAGTSGGATCLVSWQNANL